MISKFSIMALAILAVIAMPVLAQMTEMEGSGASPDKDCITGSEQDFRLDTRALWQEHILYTHLLVMSVADNSSDKEVVTTRLLRNSEDMADWMRPYYGNETADTFGNLIRDHLVIASGLVEAAKAGNSTAAGEAETDWYKNADEIAAFQSSINSYWNEAELTDMWHEHLRLTKDDAVARITGNYTADIENFDRIASVANDMADSWADGVINQFPEKFEA